MSLGIDEFLNHPQTLEAIAAVEHERWSHWQRYLHEQCIPQDDGSLVIPAHLASRWSRQMDMSYSELSKKEQESDREQAQSYIERLRLLALDLPK